MKRKIFNTFITIGSFDNILTKIILSTENKKSLYVCLCNVHMLLEAKKDQEFSKVINNADIVAPDGMPIAKAISWKYSIQQERVCGMELMPSIIEECSKRDKSIYFYGSTGQVLNNINKRITKDYPKLDTKYYSPPFRELSTHEKNEIIDKINEFNPDFVFVSLGCPKQEKWMADYKDKINSCMIGFGGSFPVYAGLQKRAPKWMCNNSLEWLYRLLLEPKRLFSRYFRTNIQFLWHSIVIVLTKK